MALIQSNMVKTGINVSELSLIAAADESILIKDIHIGGTSGGYATIFVGDSTRGIFRTDSGTLGNHLPFIPSSSQLKTILGELWDRKIFSGYPLGYGKKFIIKNTNATNMVINYDLYDKDDIKNDSPNGEKSNEFTYLAYGQPSADVSTAIKVMINKNNDPSEFSGFPFSSEAPVGEVTVHGVMFSSRGADDGTKANYIHTTYLKMMKGEKHLFDSDKNGFFCLGKDVATNGAFEAENGYDVSGEGTDLYQKTPLFFMEPLKFKKDEGLDTYWFTEVGGTPGTFLAKELEIAYVITLKKP